MDVSTAGASQLSNATNVEDAHSVSITVRTRQKDRVIPTRSGRTAGASQLSNTTNGEDALFLTVPFVIYVLVQ